MNKSSTVILGSGFSQIIGMSSTDDINQYFDRDLIGRVKLKRGSY